MNPELLLAHFNRISDAPDAIPRLRRFIVDLAIRGRLVAQNPLDEPASELLKRIQETMTPRSPFSTTGDTMPFDLPQGWQWIRFGQTVTDADAGWSPKCEDFPRSGNEWGVLKVSAVSWDEFLPDENKQLLPGVVPPERTRVHRGDFLISRANTSELVAKCVIVKDEPCNLILSDKIVRLQIAEGCNKEFVCMVNNHAEYARSYYAEEASGTSLSMQNVSRAVIYGLALPLPPLAEQPRITAKVRELMELCDRLEAATAERETRRGRLTAASHHFLNNGVSAKDLFARAHFSINHLATITTQPEQIPALRRTILSLAVRGQLVSQNLADESVSELLTRIQAEKARLIKEGLLRKEKPLAQVTDDEVAFAVPATWTWARIGTCSLLTEYGTSVKSDQAADGVPILAMGNIQDGQVVLNDRRKVPHAIDDLPQLFLKRFDLLYNRTNSAELVGKTGIYLGDDDAYTFASYLIRIRFLNSLISPLYVNLAMNAPYFRATQIVPELQQQCGQANVNGSKLRNMMIPLPPIAEQHRIVAKVDELMTLCDRLETQVTNAQHETSRLLESVLHYALTTPRGI